MRLEGQVGVLAPGYEADLILLDLNSLAFTPLNDIYRQLVYCETGSSVVLTMVAGKIVMETDACSPLTKKPLRQKPILGSSGFTLQ
jgi:5-methylthioadenosine/S-adenosylhomocysteine deaminase